MQELSRRNEHFTDSVIRRMTRISIDCGAINLAQGSAMNSAARMTGRPTPNSWRRAFLISTRPRR